MQIVDKYGNTFGQGHLIVTSKSGKPKVPTVTVAWGNITGILSNQTDLQNALNLKVPTARTITINGNTQDLSADRTWTISTGITIGSTSITSGTVGRVLFEGAGNVVQESPSIFWDITDSKLNLGSLGVQGELVINRASTGGSVGGVKAEASGAGVHIGGGGYYDSIVMTNGSGVRFNTYNGGSVSAERARITATTGNFLINTTTDSGFKFDVAGTTRIQSTLSISNPSFISGGSITHSANATLVITGGPGGGTENITFGPSNRIFINAAQSRFPNGSVQIAGTLSVGTQNATSTNMLLLGGSITAGSALGRGIGMDTTLVASANNDVLVGLDVLPTFTNGAFTGVSNFAARFGGDVVFTSGNRNIRILSPSTTGDGGSIVIAAGNATTSGTGGSITLSEGLGAGGPGRGSINIGTSGYTTVNIGGANVTVTNSGPNTGTAFRVLAGGQNGLSIYWDNLTPFMQYGLVSGRQSRFVNSTSYTFSSKVFIGTNTDAGYNLDVNGTAIIGDSSNYGTVFKVRTPGSGWNFDYQYLSLGTVLKLGLDRLELRVNNNTAYIGNNGDSSNASLTVMSGHDAAATSFAPIIFGSGRNASLTREVMRVDNQNKYVGIGTTSPFGKFDVKDGEIFVTTSIDANLRSRLTYQGLYVSRSVDGAYPENIISTSSAWLYSSRNAHAFFRDGVGILQLGTTGYASYVTVNTTGNVLIGTTTDAGFKLDVNGTIRSNSVIYANQFFGSSGTASAPSLAFNTGWGLNFASNRITFVSGSNNRGYFDSGGNFLWNENGSGAINFTLRPSNGQTSNLFVIQQNPNQGSAVLASINGSGGAYFAGDTLIGTNTAAGYKLDVNGSTRVQSGLTVSGSLNLNSSDISSAWTTYTPTWSTDGATQPSLGDGTITGAYKVIGKTVFVRVRLVFGTTTTAGTGTFYFSLPVNAAAGWGVQMPASILDNGNAWYQATVNGEYGGLTDRVALIGQSAGGANSSQGVTGVFPIGFGNTDSIQFNGSYESA